MEPILWPPSEAELNLLLEWPRRTRPQWAGILVASVAIHFLVFQAWLRVPSLVGRRIPELRVVERRIPLYFPKERMTQQTPNREKVTQKIELADLQPNRSGPAAKAGQRTPSARNFEVPKLLGAVPKIESTLPSAPSLSASQNTQVAAAPGVANGLPSAAPPPPQPGPFQNLGDATPAPPNPHPKLTPPKTNPEIQEMTQTGNSAHLAISDDVPAGAPETGAGGAATNQHSAVELESDPSGADFKLYLRTILGIVRANWRRVIPESARMGSLRGRTVVEFIIDRNGNIPKLVTADSSGSESLDRAAVVGLSMSSPLPPLPADFKGFQVRLAFTFAYNVPAK